MLRLELLRDGAVVYAVPLGPGPLKVGRATTNDLVLTDARVSGHHLVLTADDDAVWVEDLDSRNGTTLGDERLVGRRRVAVGDTLVIAERVALRIAGAVPVAVGGALVLEDAARGLLLPLRSDRLHIGSATDSDLLVPGVRPREAVLLLIVDEVHLGRDGDTAEIELGVPFEVGGGTFVVRRDTSGATRTEGLDPHRYPYHLRTALDGATGITATLTDPSSGLTHAIVSEVRATLLYVLARALESDLGAGLPADERGWLPDDEVAIGVWGREYLQQEANNFHVLVHRTRKELERAGFDPWFIEKKRKHLRLRLDHVDVTRAP